MIGHDATRAIFENDAIFEYCGIYRPGSDGDNMIALARQKALTFYEDADGLSIQLEFGGKLVDAGILPKLTNSKIFESIAPPATWSKEAAFVVFDAPALALFDARIRWCRMIVGDTGYAKDEDLQRFKAEARVRSSEYYAAKCLLHAYRAIRIIDAVSMTEPISDYEIFGILREVMAFGDTWSEGNFIINHGDNAITGQKYRKKSDEGAQKRRGDLSEHTPQVLQMMANLIEKGHTRKNAARMVAEKGIGSGAEANRKLWRRHEKDGTYP